MKRFLVPLLILSALGMAGCSSEQPVSNPNVFWNPDKATASKGDSSSVKFKVDSMLAFSAQLSNANNNKAADTKSQSDAIKDNWDDISNTVKAQYPDLYKEIDTQLKSVAEMAQEPKDRAALGTSTAALIQSLKKLQGQLKQ